MARTACSPRCWPHRRPSRRTASRPRRPRLAALPLHPQRASHSAPPSAARVPGSRNLPCSGSSKATPRPNAGPRCASRFPSGRGWAWPCRARASQAGPTGGGTFRTDPASGTCRPYEPPLDTLKERAHLGLAGHRVLIAKVDQRAAKRLLEEQVTRQVGARTAKRAGGPQQETDSTRQLVQEPRRDALDRLRGRDEQHFDRAQLDAGPREPLGRDRAQRTVDALQALDIDHQAIEKDAVQRVAGDLRERRIDVRARARLVERLPAGADDQYAVRAEVQRRADRRDLAHRAVAKVLAVHLDRGKNEGQRRGGEQVLELERHRRADPLIALPALESGTALEERHALARSVARRGHARRVQRAGVDVLLDALELKARLEHLPQRRVVEQRNRVVPRYEHHRRKPAR